MFISSNVIPEDMCFYWLESIDSGEYTIGMYVASSSFPRFWIIGNCEPKPSREFNILERINEYNRP